VLTDASGRATAPTFTANTIAGGPYTVTASTTQGSQPSASFSLTNTPGDATHLTISAPSSATAGSAFSFTVTALDQFNNTATGYGGTVHFTSSDTSAVLPANSTLSNGVGTFSATLKTSGSQTLTTTDTNAGSVTGTSNSIAVSAAAATHFAVSGPASVTAGNAFNLTVTALDAYGNVATGYRGTVKFASSDNSATLPGKYIYTASDNGVHTFPGLVLKKKGTQTITVFDASDRSILGTISISVL
jgi:hypothetical protein